MNVLDETYRPQKLQADNPRWTFGLKMVLPQKSKDQCWIGSAQKAVATWSTIGIKIARKSRMLIMDQVAIARCTDPIHVRFRLST